MHPSLRLCSDKVRRPLIQFLGKRQWPSHPEPPHPHPFAPAELKQSFNEFIAKFQSSRSSNASLGSTSAQSAQSGDKKGANVQVFRDFWEAPERLWRHDLADAEVELIQASVPMHPPCDGLPDRFLVHKTGGASRF
ncbi:hypothetical protein K474DRAFT_1622435, partial [Panus rudis PR-1116 ss-1]